jgi:hypothetical protein
MTQQEKMPRDPNQRAKSVVDMATAEPEEDVQKLEIVISREAMTLDLDQTHVPPGTPLAGQRPPQ